MTDETAEAGGDNLLGQEEIAASNGWRDSLPEDMRNEETYKSLEKFVVDDQLDSNKAYKSYLHMEKGYHDRISLPKEDWTEEQYGDFYSKLGRPETQDKYEIIRPEMPDGISYDDNLESSFLSKAHKIGLNSKQVQEILDWQSKEVIRGNNDIAVDEAMAKQVAEGELKETWRGDYERNLGLARRTAKNVLPTEFLEMITEKGLANEPRLIKTLHHLGQMMSESAVGKDDAGTKFGHDSTTARVEIDSIRADKSHKFHNAYNDPKDPQHKLANDYMDQLYNMTYGPE
jgi:hypothetical protein